MAHKTLPQYGKDQLLETDSSDGQNDTWDDDSFYCAHRPLLQKCRFLEYFHCILFEIVPPSIAQERKYRRPYQLKQRKDGRLSTDREQIL